jgi:hypothetical protein
MLGSTAWSCRSSTTDPRIDLKLDTSEAEAVLDILAGPPGEADWARLFATEPYVRLKKREAEMRREFDDERFKAFVLSAETASRAAQLRRTLDRWKRADLIAAARGVLAYLPATAVVRAKIFPVIKWQTNSFVYEPATDPAIFLYLDPKMTAGQFENTVAHELHHIGLASNAKAYEQAIAPLAPAPRAAAEWVGAFGEGIAVLAAAGGTEVDPHAADPPDVRERWRRDVANFNADLERVQGFLQDVAEGRLTDPAQIRERGFAFFGEQGPWYTVGYTMAALVERRFGRPALIACMLDMRRLLATYNLAAEADRLALWSTDLLAKIGAEPVGEAR